MYSFFLIFYILRGASGFNYLKESKFLADNYEKLYGHQLESLSPDEVELKQLKTLAFGSCHSVRRGGNNAINIWDTISAYKPDLFLWIGDAYYSNETCCDDVKESCIKMMNYQRYVDFIKDNRVDGVYDDHDYGINDGDRNFHCKDLTRDYFLDFIKKPQDHYRRTREGIYFSIEYRDPENPKNAVKIIVLDVRFNRDPYRTHVNFGRGLLSLILEASYRSIDSHCKLTCSHKGDFLGEEQWRWLEGQLHESEASAHVLISSMQVYNKCNHQESWKLLPEAQRRLTSLIFKTKPKGLVILSGDVHYATIEGDEHLYEITSSSLTHSLEYPYSTAALALKSLVKFVSTESYFKNNFGIIEYKFQEHMEAAYHIVAENGEIVMTRKQVFDGSIDPYNNLSSKNLLCYYFRECYFISTPVKTVIIILSLTTLVMVYRIGSNIYKNRSKYTVLFESDI